MTGRRRRLRLAVHRAALARRRRLRAEVREAQRLARLHRAAAARVGGRLARDLHELALERAEAAGRDDDPVAVLPRALPLGDVGGEVQRRPAARGGWRRLAQHRPAHARRAGTRIGIRHPLRAVEAEGSAGPDLDALHRSVVAALRPLAGLIAIAGERHLSVRAGVVTDRAGGGADAGRPPDSMRMPAWSGSTASSRLVAEVGKDQLAAVVDGDPAEGLRPGEVWSTTTLGPQPSAPPIATEPPSPFAHDDNATGAGASPAAVPADGSAPPSTRNASSHATGTDAGVGWSSPPHP